MPPTTSDWESSLGLDKENVRFAMTISYDGSAYAGWQTQPDFPTVQQTVEEAVAVVVGEDVKIHGSGRTDRGVHADGQVAHFDVETRMTPRALLFAVNSRLPQDIRIVSVKKVPESFHARRSAVAKEYRYVIWNGMVMPPCLRLYMCQVHKPLDVGLMREAAKLFIGKHDFVAFMANPQREIPSTVRTVFQASVIKYGARITFRVRGSGFLYKQVRSMAGLLIRIGTGREPPCKITQLLEDATSRTALVPSAPPQGLTLCRVWYRGGSKFRDEPL